MLAAVGFYLIGFLLLLQFTLLSPFVKWLTKRIGPNNYLGSDEESTDKDSASDSANEKPVQKVVVPTRKEQKKGKDAKKDESLNQIAKETNAIVRAKETGKGKAKKGKK
uniref:Uncharacterized protein n=1 Tax=Parascaris equorum TaxID=6256 RepID=A0A914RU14_PAREQ